LPFKNAQRKNYSQRCVSSSLHFSVSPQRGFCRGRRGRGRFSFMVDDDTLGYKVLATEAVVEPWLGWNRWGNSGSSP
jgi:hypothetical protein